MCVIVTPFFVCVCVIFFWIVYRGNGRRDDPAWPTAIPCAPQKTPGKIRTKKETVSIKRTMEDARLVNNFFYVWYGKHTNTRYRESRALISFSELMVFETSATEQRAIKFSSGLILTGLALWPYCLCVLSYYNLPPFAAHTKYELISGLPQISIERKILFFIISLAFCCNFFPDFRRKHRWKAKRKNNMRFRKSGKGFSSLHVRN